jgi:hypothetical protein
LPPRHALSLLDNSSNVKLLCASYKLLLLLQTDLVQFFYDPYDWSFPPDLIIHGSPIKPSLSDIGLDDSWNHEDPANLKKVLGKLARIIQVP